MADRLGAQEVALEINVDDPIPYVLGEREGRPGDVDAGIADEHVNVPQFIHRILGQRLAIRSAGNVSHRP